MPIPIDIGDIVAGKYVVESTLGKGGMGVVLAARHIELDHRVAIKVLREGVLGSNEAHARFMQEARALARFQSDHLVRVFDVGRLEAGTPYMVMEYLEGADLATVLRNRGSLDIAESVDYVVQACAGLAEAHAAGVVHRDLKPGNLFLAERIDGTRLVKIIDFGIAKSLAGQGKLTRDSMALGSPTYMSPEQLKSAKEVDARTDVWALGVILYKLLTSVPPFPADDMGGHLRAVRLNAPVPVRDRRPEVPEALDHAILSCLRVDRDERTQTVVELARAIADYGTSESRDRCDRMMRISTRPLAGADGPSSTDRPPYTSSSAPPSGDVSTRREGPGSFHPPAPAPLPVLPRDSVGPQLDPTLVETDGGNAPRPSRGVSKTIESTIPAGPVVPPASVPPGPVGSPAGAPSRSRKVVWLVAGGIAVGVLLTLGVVALLTWVAGAPNDPKLEPGGVSPMCRSVPAGDSRWPASAFSRRGTPPVRLGGTASLCWAPDELSEPLLEAPAQFCCNVMGKSTCRRS